MNRHVEDDELFERGEPMPTSGIPVDPEVLHAAARKRQECERAVGQQECERGADKDGGADDVPWPSDEDFAGELDESADSSALPRRAARRRRKGARRGDGAAADAQNDGRPSNDDVVWKSHILQTQKGEPRKNLANGMTVLGMHPKWSDTLAYNEFAQQVMKRRPPPTREQDGISSTGEWTANDAVRTSAWISSVANVDLGHEQVERTALAIAERCSFHPVRDYLTSLKHDGVPRLNEMLSTYFHAPSSEYTRAVGTKFMIAAVARVVRPGCKVDTMLVLEGKQALRKSSGVAALVPDEMWFSDTPPNLGNKDAYVGLVGKWFIEFAELDALRGKEHTQVKQFLSSRVDNYRRPYDSRSRDWPRHCVFVGTTNESAYLNDATGERRYWPVKCGENGERVDIDGIVRDRDQLWAEAVARYQNGECWWLDSAELEQLATAEQQERTIDDPWMAQVEAWLERPTVPNPELLENGKPVRRSLVVANGITTADVMIGALNLLASQQTKHAESKIGDILRGLGWTHVTRPRTPKGEPRPRRYHRPPPQDTASRSSPDDSAPDGVRPGDFVPDPPATPHSAERSNRAGERSSHPAEEASPIGPQQTAAKTTSGPAGPTGPTDKCRVYREKTGSGGSGDHDPREGLKEPGGTTRTVGPESPAPGPAETASTVREAAQ